MNKVLRKLLDKPELIFLCLAGFFGMLSVFLLPILSAPDENQHFQVEYAMFSSHQRAGHDLVFNESMILASVRGGHYKELFTHKTSAQTDGVALNFGSYVFDGKTKASSFDFMRLPQALGVLLGRLIYPSLGVMVIVGRIFNLALYVGVLYLIIKHIRFGKWAVLFIACLPMAVHQAGSLSYDSINLLAIFAWVAFIINRFADAKQKISGKELALGIILFILLLITKSNNILLALLGLALPLRYWIGDATLIKLRSKPYYRYVKILFFACTALIGLAALYILGHKLLAGNAFHPHRLLHVLVNTFFWGDLTLIDATTTGMVGMFGNFYYHLPEWCVIIAFITFALIMLTEKFPSVTRRLALTSLALFAGSVLLITIGMYYGWAMKGVRLGANAEVADGIQGRYFTPLLILLIPPFAYAQRFIKITTDRTVLMPVLTSIVTCLLLTFYALQTWHFFTTVS